MSTDQRPHIPRSAWACFAAGWFTVGLMIRFVLDVSDMVPSLLPGVVAGLMIAGVVTTVALGAWSLSTINRSRGHLRGGRLAVWGLVLPTVCFCGSSLVLPACQLVGRAAVRKLARGRLEQIGLAFRAYHNQHGHLPPAAIRSPEGKPLLSWRVALLPYLNHNDLYQRFHLNEPWDSPHNLSLLPEMPAVYRMSPDIRSPADMTYFQVVVGPGTAFERDCLRLPEDFPDGPSNTILVAEAATPVQWTQPADLTFDPDGPVPELGAMMPSGFRRRDEVICVLAADGVIHHIYRHSASFSLHGVITRNGGEKLPSDLNW